MTRNRLLLFCFLLPAVAICWWIGMGRWTQCTPGARMRLDANSSIPSSSAASPESLAIAGQDAIACPLVDQAARRRLPPDALAQPECKHATEHSRRAPIAGKLVYAEALEPIPFFPMVIQGDDGAEETVNTGIDGEFSSASDYCSGSITIKYSREATPNTVQVVHDATIGALVELAIDCPPTLLLTPGPPSDVPVTEMRCWLFGRSPNDIEAYPEWGWSLQCNGSHWYSRPTKHVDFEAITSSESPWRFFARDRDGLCVGRSVVTKGVGLVTLDMNWELRGALRIELDPPSIVDRVMGVTVRDSMEQVQRLDKSAIRRPGVGPLTISSLRPGAVTVEIAMSGCRPLSASTSIEAGKTATVIARPDCGESDNVIRGFIYADSEEFVESNARVILLSPESGQEYQREAVVQWNIRSPMRAMPRGSFSFAGLAPGEYLVGLTGVRYRIQPSSTQRVRTGENVVFNICSSDLPWELEFCVVDRDGEELSHWGLEVSGGASRNVVSFPMDNWVPISGAMVDDSATWVVWKHGYRRATGAISEGLWRRSLERKALTIVVELKKGFDLIGRVFSESGHPIQYASIAADGVVVGQSDGDGRFNLELQDWPNSVDVKYLDWRYSLLYPAALRQIDDESGRGELLFVLAPNN